MSTKRVIDYIVVSGDINYVGFMKRINSRIKALEESIKSCESSIERLIPKLNRYEDLYKAFKKLQSLEIGKMYKTVPYMDTMKWIGGITYPHPLMDSFHNNEEIQLLPNKKRESIESFEKIKVNLKELQ